MMVRHRDSFRICTERILPISGGKSMISRLATIQRSSIPAPTAELILISRCQSPENSFVPRLTDVDDETLMRNWEYRITKLQSIEKQQFQMVYYGHFVYNDTEDMTVSERDRVYNILYETKKKEKEDYEKAMREAKAKQSSRGSRRASRK